MTFMGGFLAGGLGASFRPVRAGGVGHMASKAVGAVYGSSRRGGPLPLPYSRDQGT
jgi:hypothetical protein